MWLLCLLQLPVVWGVFYFGRSFSTDPVTTDLVREQSVNQDCRYRCEARAVSVLQQLLHLAARHKHDCVRQGHSREWRGHALVQAAQTLAGQRLARCVQRAAIQRRGPRLQAWLALQLDLKRSQARPVFVFAASAGS